MKNKKYLFLLILLFPALLKLILEFTTVNSKKLPHYGPKTESGNDTIFYEVSSEFKQQPSSLGNESGDLKNHKLDTIKHPLYVVCFIKQDYKKDNYRLAGFSEYVQYNFDKIKLIPFVIVTPCDGFNSENCFKEFEKLHKGHKNILNLFWNSSSFDSINAVYFKEKPIHIDYSFFALIDKNRNIRGYYDGRYVSEIKRLIEEYQHLRLKEEKQILINRNKIESK